LERSETEVLTEITVRALSSHDEHAAAVRLQQEIWGFADVELLPVRLFVVAEKIGGQVFGAFDGGRMVGFCLSIPGIKAGVQSYLHSHMLGVLTPWRDRHVGRALKLAQRQDALARGIPLIEWTFDPLEIKNAFFNIERLGAIVRRYVLNQYGATSSHLHGSLPTDRCVAEWWIDSRRVEAIAAGQPLERPAIEARIEVPASIGTLRRSEPAEARRIQAAISESFLECFRTGLAVVGFERSETACAYLLGKWPSE